MQRRIAVVVITLAILAPGVIAGTVVASYFIHHKFTAPPITTVQSHTSRRLLAQEPEAVRADERLIRSPGTSVFIQA